MLKYTQKANIEVFKNMSRALSGSLYYLSGKDNHVFELSQDMISREYQVMVRNKQAIVKTFRGGNYMDLAQEVYSFAKKNKILPEVKGIELQSEFSEVTQFLDTHMSYPQNANPFLEESRHKIQRVEDINIDSFLDKGMYKLRRASKGQHFELCARGDTALIEYSRSQAIAIIMKYISYLVDQKKKGEITSLSNKVNIVFESFQQQNILIVEGDEDIDETPQEEFIDGNLTNKFVLCSLETLTIDLKAEKIWLNKTILKEDIKLVIFN